MRGITRREFIRLAGAAGGASLFGGCTFLSEEVPPPAYIKGAPASDPIETIPGIETLYTVCGLCPGNCGISCRIAQGALVKIGGNPFSPISTGKPLSFETPLADAASRGASVCAIGGSGIQTLYDPFRVARPLKRVGPRGSGKWAAITWGEALSEIISGGDLFGEGSMVGLASIEKSGTGMRFLVGRADWGALALINRFVSGFQRAAVVPDRDLELEELRLLAAENVFGAAVGPVDADYSNARTIVSVGDAPIDSGIPLVSVARQIADARVDSRGLRWAVVDPRLSTSASKADIWVPVIPGRDIWLALGIARSLIDRYGSLQLEDGEFKAAVMAESVETFSERCGVPPAIIKRLADMIAEGGERTAVVPGRGVLAGENGLATAQAILALNRMVGSYPGSGGLAFRDDGFLDAPHKVVMTGSDGPRALAPAQALLLWHADPVYDDPKSSAILANAREVPLFVAIDTRITESTAYADYILPDTTYLERWDLCVSPPSVTAPGVGIRRPVVGRLDPASGRYFPILPETRPMEEILADIGGRLKLKGFPAPSADPTRPTFTAWGFYKDFFSSVLASMNRHGFSITGSDADMNRALERGGIFASPGSPAAKKPRKPPTKPMGMLRLPAPELGPAEGFLLMGYSLPFHRSPASGVNSWLMEVLPENRLLINTADARKLGVAQGDKIAVEAIEGGSRAECKAQLVPGIRPGVVALAGGFGYKGAGALPQVIDSASLPADKTRGKGVNAAALAAHKTPPRVNIRKV
jgi:thiosulfate reductase / polysulfide reductase chain A